MLGPRLVINEIDYDQNSVDTTEFVEVFNAGSAAADLSGLAVVFVNGANGTEASRVTLSGTLAAGAYLVLANDAVVVGGGAQVLRFAMLTDNIQNGPDAVGLYDTATHTLLDALAYDLGTATSLTAAIDGNSLQFVEGTPPTVKDSSTATRSLVRLPNGTDSNVASADWKQTANVTPGVANLP